jgi:hypothetical protein
MANTYRAWSKSRIPAAGDLNWNDENDDNFDIVETLFNNIAIRQNRVISGVAVTDNGGLDVAYASGVIEVNGARYSITGSTLTLTVGPSGGRLKNYIYVDSSGTVVDSTTLPTGQFVMLSIADTDDTDILRLSDLRVYAPASIQFSSGTSVNEFSTDATMAGDSDDAVPTEKAVKEFVETNRRTQRNLIINGDFQVAQRSTSVTGKTTTGYYTVDRFQNELLTAGTFGYSQSAVLPAGEGLSKSLKVDCEVAQSSLAAGAYHRLRQRIMGQDLQLIKKGTASAEPLTMQFWVRSAKTGTYIVEILDNDNSRHICASYTINSADTWEYKTVTFAGDTTGTLDNDNNESLSINWWLAAGTNFTSGTLATSWASTTAANRAVGQVNLSDVDTNDWYVAGVQFELGSYDGPFEHMSYVDSELDCFQFYFVGSVSGCALAGATTSLVVSPFIAFPTQMRKVPTITTSGESFQGALGSGPTLSAGGGRKNGCLPQFSVTGGTAGYAGFGAYSFVADSELT